jgi:hypothetical protein
MAISVEASFTAWDDNEGVGITAGPDAEGVGYIQLRPHGAASSAYFGEFEIGMSYDLAEAVGEALIKAARNNPKQRSDP